MKFKYIDFEGPETTECYGVKFVRGIPSEVSDPVGIKKLTRNPYFEAVTEGAEVEAPKVETVVKRGRPAKARYVG